MDWSIERKITNDLLLQHCLQTHALHASDKRMGIHARSRHRELNTLTCLVMRLEGWKTTVELQNDAYVSGLVTEVDA